VSWKDILIFRRLRHLEGEVRRLMSATDDLKAGQAAIDKAVADVIAFLKNLAGQISGGVSATDAEAIATDLNSQAAALEAAIAPPPPPPTA
jgi:molybdopterin biosynthesis enzyme